MTLIVPSTPYGIAILTDFISSTPQYVIPSSWITSMQLLGVSWIRLMASWKVQVETTEGVQNFSSIDANIQNLNAAGFNVHLVLNNFPSWYTTLSYGGSNFVPPTGTYSCESVATMVANRYKTGSVNGVVSSLEWYNEDYSLSTSDPPYNGGLAADCMNTFYPVIKSIDPTIEVIAPAMFKCDTTYVNEWFSQLYNGGGISASGGIGSNCDRLNVHLYRGNLVDPLQTGSTNNVIEQIYAAYNASVAAGYPTLVRMTEFGYAATTAGGSGNLTYPVQAQYIMECYDAVRKIPICDGAYYYTMNFSDDNSLQGGGTGSTSGKHESWVLLQSFIDMYPQWIAQNNLRLLALNKRNNAVSRSAALTRTIAATRST